MAFKYTECKQTMSFSLRCRRGYKNKMAVSSKATVTLGQRLWNALSAWTVRQSGYQKLGK